VIKTWKDLGGEKEPSDSCDFAVIGTGAAGAAIGRVLVDAGLDVIFIEEGPPIDAHRADRSVAEATRHIFRDGGTQVAMGRAVIPILQGRCVGGSTAINSAICWRIPDDAWDRAFARFGLGEAIPLKELHRHYDRLESDLTPTATPEAVSGRNNLLMRDGAAKLGWMGQPTRRYEKGCTGSGRCIQSCVNHRKRSMDVTYIPHAIGRGARVYATCRAIGFLHKRGRVAGVRARVWNPDTGERLGTVKIHARRGVVLAASCVQTPLLLGTLKLAGRDHVGAHFRGHPGTGVAGFYEEPVRAWTGATQGYEVLQFRKDGIKMETLALGPELGSVRLHGFGMDFAQLLAEYDHYAVWAIAARADAEGTIRGDVDGGARISYSPTEGDLAKIRSGVRALAEMHVAAGAKAIVTGLHGLPLRIGPDELGRIDQVPLDGQHFSLVMTHLFGTARMAHDPSDGVVGPDFQVFDAPGLYVVDSSVFPQNIGVNPQHTIMAVAMLAGERMAA
jgi:choline dehydrogenase-like flavoprotein